MSGRWHRKREGGRKSLQRQREWARGTDTVTQRLLEGGGHSADVSSLHHYFDLLSLGSFAIAKKTKIK